MRYYCLIFFFYGLIGKVFIPAAQAQILNADRYGATLDSTKPFKAVVDLGFSIDKQLSLLLNAHTKVDLSYFYKKSLFVLVGQYRFVQSGGKELVHNGFAHSRVRLFKAHWVHPERFAQYQSDGIRGMERRILGGANARFILKEYPKGSWHVGIGAMYEYERWNYSAVDADVPRPPDLPLQLHYIKLNSYLSLTQRFREWMHFQMTLYAQARPDSFIRYPRIALNGKLSFQITKHIEFAISYQLFHDSRPPTPIDQLFYVVSHKLSFRF